MIELAPHHKIGLSLAKPVMIASGPAKFFALPTEAVIALLYLGIFLMTKQIWNLQTQSLNLK